MCKVMEDLRNETLENAKRDFAQSLAEDNVPIEKIAQYVKESIDTVKQWIAPNGSLAK